MSYRVWVSSGSGPVVGAQCSAIEDALHFVNTYSGRGSLAIGLPDGGWYRFANDRSIIRNHRKSSRRAVTSQAFVALHQTGRRSEANAEVRAALKDVSPGGMRLSAANLSRQVWTGLPMWIEITPELSCAGRVAWARNGEIGVALALRLADVYDSYQGWCDLVTAPPLFADGSSEHKL